MDALKTVLRYLGRSLLIVMVLLLSFMTATIIFAALDTYTHYYEEIE